MYIILLIIVSMLFSISLCGIINSCTSDLFECGFYSIILTTIKYKFNYWMICFHFMLFEQELIIALIIIFSFNSILPYYLIILLFIILLFDTLFIICSYIFFIIYH